MPKTKLTYAEWVKKADAIIQSRTGLSLLDLEDMDYFGLYEDGVTPGRAATKAIRNAQGQETYGD